MIDLKGSHVKAEIKFDETTRDLLVIFISCDKSGWIFKFNSALNIAMLHDTTFAAMNVIRELKMWRYSFIGMQAYLIHYTQQFSYIDSHYVCIIV